MESNTAIEALSALAQPTRLDAFRLLVRHEPDGLPAGDVAERLRTPQNTMSAHLAILSRSGLIRGERRGRSIAIAPISMRFARSHYSWSKIAAPVRPNCARR
jgi:ArsR family transcriptional regulator, arsenate/arsenite/antimonite-responsive transcriptional repressor